MGGLFRQSDQNLRLTERFTLQSADTLRYEFTVDDPTVGTAPWTAAIYWKRAEARSTNTRAMKAITVFAHAFRCPRR